MAKYEVLKEKLGEVIKKSLKADDYAVRELVANVAEFDEWLGLEELEDERVERLTRVTGNVSVPAILKAAVRIVVKANLQAMKESGIEHLLQEEVVVDKLSRYVAGYEKWYPEWKKEQDQLAWLDDRAYNTEAYFGGYGGEESIGRGNLFDDDMAPHPDLLVDPEEFTFDAEETGTSELPEEE